VVRDLEVRLDRRVTLPNGSDEKGLKNRVADDCETPIPLTLLIGACKRWTEAARDLDPLTVAY
jgi:hypothetical protein